MSRLEKLYQTDEWKETAKGNGLVPVWRGGAEFNDYVAEQSEQMRQISQEIGVIK